VARRARQTTSVFFEGANLQNMDRELKDTVDSLRESQQAYIIEREDLEAQKAQILTELQRIHELYTSETDALKKTAMEETIHTLNDQLHALEERIAELNERIIEYAGEFDIYDIALDILKEFTNTGTVHLQGITYKTETTVPSGLSIVTIAKVTKLLDHVYKYLSQNRTISNLRYRLFAWTGKQHDWINVDHASITFRHYLYILNNGYREQLYAMANDIEQYTSDMLNHSHGVGLSQHPDLISRSDIFENPDYLIPPIDAIFTAMTVSGQSITQHDALILSAAASISDWLKSFIQYNAERLPYGHTLHIENRKAMWISQHCLDYIPNPWVQFERTISGGTVEMAYYPVVDAVVRNKDNINVTHVGPGNLQNYGSIQTLSLISHNSSLLSNVLTTFSVRESVQFRHLTYCSDMTKFESIEERIRGTPLESICILVHKIPKVSAYIGIDTYAPTTTLRCIGVSVDKINLPEIQALDKTKHIEHKPVRQELSGPIVIERDMIVDPFDIQLISGDTVAFPDKIL